MLMWSDIADGLHATLFPVLTFLLSSGQFLFTKIESLKDSIIIIVLATFQSYVLKIMHLSYL